MLQARTANDTMGRRKPDKTNAAPRRSAGKTGFVAGLLVGVLITWAVAWSIRSAPDAVSPVTPRPDPLRTPPEQYAWTAQPEPAFPIPPSAVHLRGATIVLDPGHVGQRDPGGTWKRGPTGLREAEVNLRVAQFLREFLKAAGANVILTREIDESLDLSDAEDLRQRIEVANRASADLFLSIHHNGAADPEANYTTIYYHGSAEDHPTSLCAARHLLTGLDSALRLETQVGCALRSDDVLYPDNGLAVLRLAQVPAVLTEASFHSNPEEERRLRDPVYNRREAYGLFLGLTRWAQAGLPAVRLVRPGDGKVRAGGEIVIAVDDGLSGRGGAGAERLRIQSDSIVVKIDGRRIEHRLDRSKRQVRATVPRGRQGRCTLWVDFANVFGQHVIHPWLGLEVTRR